MKPRPAKFIIATVVALASLMACSMIWLPAKRALYQMEKSLREQSQRCAALSAECLRLSNQCAEIQNAPKEDHLTELLKLRHEAELLRKQSNEVIKQVAEHRPPAQGAGGNLNTMPSESGSSYVVSDLNTDEYALQLRKIAAGEDNRVRSDARNLTSALRAFARQHQGQIPSTFADAALYQRPPETTSADGSPKAAMLSGVDDFEIVYHGSLNELTNIPQQAVVLMRQRQPWPTPNGKWARIYTMADGRLYIVESDDNFGSWEAEHVIPPRAGEIHDQKDGAR